MGKWSAVTLPEGLEERFKELKSYSDEEIQKLWEEKGSLDTFDFVCMWWFHSELNNWACIDNTEGVNAPANFQIFFTYSEMYSAKFRLRISRIACILAVEFKIPRKTFSEVNGEESKNSENKISEISDKKEKITEIRFNKDGGITFFYEDIGPYVLKNQGDIGKNWDIFLSSFTPEIVLGGVVEILAMHVLKLSEKVSYLENKSKEPLIDEKEKFTSVIDTCDFGHKFAKLKDHPTRDGKARCPQCLASELDGLRAEHEVSYVSLDDPSDFKKTSLVNTFFTNSLSEHAEEEFKSKLTNNDDTNDKETRSGQ